MTTVGTLSGGLNGPPFTVPGAELEALVTLVELTAGDLVVYSDCSYVTKGFAAGAAAVHRSHASEWQRLWTACGLRGGAVDVRKVRSHRTAADIADGSVDPVGFFVNHVADSLADTAAKDNEITFADSAAVELTDTMAWLIQGRLVAVNIACAEHGQAMVLALPAHRPPAPRNRRAEATARLLTQVGRSGHSLAMYLDTDRLVCTQCFRSTKQKGVRRWISKYNTCRAQPILGVHESHVPHLRNQRGLIFCARCGSWGVGRAVKLPKPCAPATRAGRPALARLEKGLWPSEKIDKWPDDI